MLRGHLRPGWGAGRPGCQSARGVHFCPSGSRLQAGGRPGLDGPGLHEERGHTCSASLHSFLPNPVQAASPRARPALSAGHRAGPGPGPCLDTCLSPSLASRLSLLSFRDGGYKHESNPASPLCPELFSPLGQSSRSGYTSLCGPSWSLRPPSLLCPQPCPGLLLCAP